MNRFETGIVVDGSALARHALASYLQEHCDCVVAVGSVEELRAHLGDASVSLVVIDSTAAGAMAWLQETSHQPQKPAVLVVTHLPSRSEEVRATLLGAIGYLAKPVTFDQLARAIAPSI